MANLVAMSSLDAVPCPRAAQATQVSCSVATVPLDSSSPDPTQMVELMVAVVDNGDPNGTGPVVFLQGGPGVGSVDLAPSFVGRSHDLVFVDQRGTGASEPKLDCPEVDELWEAQFSDDPNVRLADRDAAFDQAYAACANRLRADGIDFDHYNTQAAATDIELIRQLLGYDPWVLWGISYGTRLGLTVMRDHPAGVRAAVLDSVVPFEVDFFATIPEHGLRAVQALDGACDIDRCTDDHGDFLENLTTLVRRLDAEPVVVEATRPGSGAVFPFRVGGSELIDMVFTQLYSTRSLRSLPRQLARADFGGLDEMVNTFVTRRDPTELDLAIGLYYTTWCREEVPFYDESVDDRLLAENEAAFGPALRESLSSDGVESLCESFAVEASPPADDQMLVSDIPTLVFAGAFDPITPPAWSRQVADALPNSIYVELPDHGHGMATACPAGIRLAFLMDPTSVPDTTCVAAIVGPDFD